MSSPPEMSSHIDLVMSTKTEKSLCKNSFILNMKQKNHSPSPNIPICYKPNKYSKPHTSEHQRFFTTGWGHRKTPAQPHTFTEMRNPERGEVTHRMTLGVSKRALTSFGPLTFQLQSLSNRTCTPSSGKEFSRRCYTQICYSLQCLSIRMRLVILVGKKTKLENTYNRYHHLKMNTNLDHSEK